MNFLDNITLTQKDLIIRLPYRVGYYISQADKTGGDESDEKEMQALSNIIEGYAETMLVSEAIQYVMTETIQQKHLWGEWNAKLNMVPKECRAAMEVVEAHLGKKDMHGFQVHLMEIGEAVALAFCEVEHVIVEEQNAVQKLQSRVGSYVHGLTGKGVAVSHKYDEAAYINISPDEKQALSRIAQGLGIKG